MAELIDVYTKDDEHIGVADRNVAHRFGLWHKTVHCWIIKDRKSLVFQKRSEKLAVDPGKLFSTASGHVKAGETIAEGFQREIFEETGVKVENPVEIFHKPYLYDTVLKSGREHHDYITWYLFAAKCDLPLAEYKPQDDEIDGFAELDIAGLYKLAGGKINSMRAPALLRRPDNAFELTETDVREDDFLMYAGETLANKFALWLKEVCGKLGLS
ncbi:MAG: NUDIX domain-containing protein [Rickettsiales bacterium]|jgi:isopentenyldiphosphate isomerase|nr:NUDIX domain-containing protein [Rickettsiales bacterium]